MNLSLEDMQDRLLLLQSRVNTAVMDNNEPLLKDTFIELDDLRVRWATEREQSITCPRCGRTSYHPKDVEYGYCGNCHDYTTPRP